MLAVNFQGMNEAQTIALQDLIPGKSEGLKGGTNANGADNIQVFNAETQSYSIYFLYVNGRKPTDPKNYFWCSTESGYPITDKAFGNGDSFWFKKNGETDLPISVSGQVSLEAKRTVTIATGWNMIGNAFPVDYNPNILGADFWKGLISEKKATGGTNANSADNIQVFDPATQAYAIYFLYNNGRKATDPKNGCWCSTASGYPVVELPEIIMPVGKGVWYKALGTGFDFDINSPIK